MIGFDAVQLSYDEPLADGVSMRVWRAVNPVNGLAYGYGGLKLIRTSALREMGQAVDVLAALPGRVEFSGHTAGTTLFNQTPVPRLEGGFRECAIHPGLAPAAAKPCRGDNTVR
ncbi:MAG: hypothetical protein ACRDRP_19180 [Pseudonocardiaceae bacterium]